jgi:hypothetical protein
MFVRDRVRALAGDRVSVALFAVFILAAAFYLWTAGTSEPLSLTGGNTDHYNELANAFIHLHLSVARAPAALLNLPEPYNPEQNEPVLRSINDLGRYHDLALYRGHLFLTWGPAPVVVWLVPAHLLGLSPTGSVTTSLFAIVGLGFVLATLRLLLRQVGDVSLWVCVLAALTLALASAVQFILRSPEIYEEAITGGYCFAMAGIWLALSAAASGRASLKRLVLMSLCIGLAVASRPNLVLVGVVLVPVYLALRRARRRRGLLMALVIPVGVCILLLLTYNQVRFDNPLENGAKYQLAGMNQLTAPWNELNYVLPGLWFYGVSTPRAAIVFPFLRLVASPESYPGSLPGPYPEQLEATGGLLPMAPIVVFLAALPWIWRRRPALLGGLAAPLLMLACAGIGCVLFLSYVFFSATERYTVDFTTLFLLGALAAWIALSSGPRGRRRRIMAIGGGVLATWSCLAGVAVSFTGYYNLLAVNHPDTWKALQDVGAPVSSAIAMVKGHPVLAEVSAPNPPLLPIGDPAHVVIVSPDARTTTVYATLTPVATVGSGLEIRQDPARFRFGGPGNESATYQVPVGGGTVPITVHVSQGFNRFDLTSLSLDSSAPKSAVPPSQQFLFLGNVSIAGSP